MDRSARWRSGAWIQAHQGFATPYDRELCHNIYFNYIKQRPEGERVSLARRQSLLTTTYSVTVRVIFPHGDITQGEGRKVPADPLPLLEGYRTCKATSPIAHFRGVLAMVPWATSERRSTESPLQTSTSPRKDQCLTRDMATFSMWPYPNEEFVDITPQTYQ